METSARATVRFLGEYAAAEAERDGLGSTVGSWLLTPDGLAPAA